MKKGSLIKMMCLLGIALVGCAEGSFTLTTTPTTTTASTTTSTTTTTTASTTTTSTEPEATDDYDYNPLMFPEYMVINPIRFMNEGPQGVYEGWQDFGLTGEIMTHPWPYATYTYQMYSYFIRTDLQSLHVGVDLPENLEDLPEWITQTNEDGHRILWFSMTGRTLPSAITLLETETITSTSGTQTFLRAEYEVTVGDAVQDWIIYFMDVEGTFSSYSIRVNEYFEMVESTGDLIVSTYQLKAIEGD